MVLAVPSDSDWDITGMVLAVPSDSDWDITGMVLDGRPNYSGNPFPSVTSSNTNFTQMEPAKIYFCEGSQAVISRSSGKAKWCDVAIGSGGKKLSVWSKFGGLRVRCDALW